MGRGWRQLETKTTKTTNCTLNTMLVIDPLQPGDLSPNNSALKTELILNTKGLPVVRRACPCNLMTGEATHESVLRVFWAVGLRPICVYVVVSCARVFSARHKCSLMCTRVPHSEFNCGMHSALTDH